MGNWSAAISIARALMGGGHGTNEAPAMDAGRLAQLRRNFQDAVGAYGPDNQPGFRCPDGRWTSSWREAARSWAARGGGRG